MKISRDNKTKLNITFTMVALAMIALATATYAWFTLSLSTKVNTIDMEVTAGTYLKISTEDHGKNLDLYDSVIENADIEGQIGYKLDTLKLAPLTSENGTVLYSEQRDEVKAAAKKFLEFDLYFIASTDLDVYLTEEDSKAGENDGTEVKATSADAKKKKVQQAVRISFDPADESAKIYEPNKNGSTTLSVLGKGTQDTFTGAKSGEAASKLFSLKAETPKKVTVRVWIEGDDSDCDDDVIQATFSAQLRFEGKE